MRLLDRITQQMMKLNMRPAFWNRSSFSISYKHGAPMNHVVLSVLYE